MHHVVIEPNLKKYMFLQNFFPATILGICYVFPVIDIIPLFDSQTISFNEQMWCKIKSISDLCSVAL
jgi:hypothetical protein